MVSSVSQNSDTRVGTLTYDAANTPITQENGYELARQAGKYYALEFFDRVFKGGYYNENFYGNSTVSHTEAQNAFIRTAEFGGNSIGKDTAMLIDGTWWMNEASSTFNSLVGIYGENAGASKRNFSIMPLSMPRENYERPGETTTEFAGSVASVKTNYEGAYYQGDSDDSLPLNGYVYSFDGDTGYIDSTNLANGIISVTGLEKGETKTVEVTVTSLYDATISAQFDLTLKCLDEIELNNGERLDIDSSLYNDSTTKFAYTFTAKTSGENIESIKIGSASPTLDTAVVLP